MAAERGVGLAPRERTLVLPRQVLAPSTCSGSEPPSLIIESEGSAWVDFAPSISPRKLTFGATFGLGPRPPVPNGPSPGLGGRV